MVVHREPAGKLALALGRHTADTILERLTGMASFSRAMSFWTVRRSHRGCSKTCVERVGARWATEGGLGRF